MAHKLNIWKSNGRHLNAFCHILIVRRHFTCLPGSIPPSLCCLSLHLCTCQMFGPDVIILSKLTNFFIYLFLMGSRFFPILGNETSPESFLLHNALARKPKRIRTAFSPSQLLRLEHAFEKNHYVVGAERKQLAHSLSLTETQVRHSNHVPGVVPHLTFTSTFLICNSALVSFLNERAAVLRCTCLPHLRFNVCAPS